VSFKNMVLLKVCLHYHYHYQKQMNGLPK